MSIQWYPGHMHAAQRKAAKSMETIDLVIEVLDARIPVVSSNPLIDSLRKHRQRPALKVLNKADLADPKVTEAWMRYYAAQPNTQAVTINCRKPGDVAKIPALCLKLAAHRGTVEKPLRMMIMGVPNVGKSTLMNALLKRRVAAVGDQPAVTKSQQRLDINDRMMLTDTPGMLWPKIDLPEDGLMLAACHNVGDKAYHEEEVAWYFATRLLAQYPAALKARYGLEPADMDGPGVVEAIARKRGLLLKGGVPDFEKAALAFLHDFRNGVLGQISLQHPDELPARTAKIKELARQKPAPEAETDLVRD